ncbi:MAG: MATE family efflux transporter [Clostridiales bacterium]|nr:MATE family efflux transporter [Clostridiales bacterium]
MRPMFSPASLKKLIYPLVIEQFLAVLVGIADTIMVSALGEAAISGVSLVDMINVLIINIFAALATGGAVVASQYIGAGNERQARLSASQLIFISLTISLAIMGLCLAFNRNILMLLFGSAEDGVIGSAQVYFRISAYSYPFIAVYNACAALFRAMGNSKVSMLTSVAANIFNVIGNAVLIYGAKMGVAGAATASAIARFLCMAVMLGLLFRRDNIIYLSVKDGFRLNPMLIKRILRIAVPGSLESSVFQLGRVLVVSIIAGFGTVQIAANAVANNLDGFGIVPGQAIGLAVVTVVGQCVGAEDKLQVRYYTRKLIKITYIILAVWNVFLIVTLPLTLKFYNLSGETLSLASTLIIIHNGLAIFLWPLSFVLPNSLRAASDVKYPMAVSIFSMITFRILFSYILGVNFGMGAIGVWIAMIIDWIFRITMFIIRYRGEKWLSHKIDAGKRETA